MITVITGVPGSGKTLYALEWMERQQRDGREIYTDVEDCTLKGLLPAPEDWRELPDGALCVYDEAHQRFPATGKAGLSSDPRIKDLDTHRHHGYDLVFITQASTRLHHDIRKLTGQHIHVQRNFGANTVTLYRWERAANENDKNDRQAADVQLWHYPKRLYKFYKSATVHTHTRRVPRKLISVLVLVLGLFGFGAYTLSQNRFFTGEINPPSTPTAPKTQLTEPVTFAPEPSSLAWVASERLPPISGCIASKRDCRCYARDGRILDMAESACREAMQRPLPLTIGGARSTIEPAVSFVEGDSS